LGVEKTVVEDVDFDEELGVLVVSVRPTRSARGRCGRCGRRCRGYDQGVGRRRWRALDVGTVAVWLEADAPRVSCPAQRTGRARLRCRPIPGQGSTRPCATRSASTRWSRTSNTPWPATPPCHRTRGCAPRRGEPTAPRRPPPHGVRHRPADTQRCLWI